MSVFTSLNLLKGLQVLAWGSFSEFFKKDLMPLKRIKQDFKNSHRLILRASQNITKSRNRINAKRYLHHMLWNNLLWHLKIHTT